MPVDETHDPRLRSWVASANVPGADFPIQNLPFGVFWPAPAFPPHIGVAIGDRVLDLYDCHEQHLFTGSLADVGEACRARTLNPLMALGPLARRELRAQLSRWLRDEESGNAARVTLEPLLRPQSDVVMLLPAEIGDYTDFYASIFHATNVGSMFRPDEPLLPNYKYVPIGYHGRASSIVPSGTAIRRPHGQRKPEDAAEPVFGPTRRLDYELELGMFVGRGNRQGEPVRVIDAEDHMFGVCLLNDWSGRDIQQWEYQPLGPFLSKNFATSVSPWVVTLDALEPFRAPAQSRPDPDPRPLPYLDLGSNGFTAAIDIRLEVLLTTGRMREEGRPAQSLSRSSSRHLYWTFSQMLAHHTSNGCNLRSGDLLASGTVSGPTRDSRGCLLELTWRGTEPIALPTGESRRFLEDGDEVIMRGWCEREGFARIGLGECRGEIVS